jgi:hypothetical protein
MANILYDEVFLDAGASVFAYWYLPDPLANVVNPPTATYVAWEPLPYFAELPLASAPSYTYSEVNIYRYTGLLHFAKTVTNTGPTGSFVFLWSSLP